MAAKFSTYRWESGTFLATASEIEDGSAMITADLEGRGISVAGGASGGGYILPWPASYAANVRLLKDMDEGEARSAVESSMRNAFNFTSEVTHLWQAIEENIKKDSQDVAKLPGEAFPYLVVISVGLTALAAIYVTSKLS